MTILGGASRLVIAALFVVALNLTSGATGMMIGVFAGYGLAMVIAMWRTRGLWSLPKEPFDARNLLAQILPLMLGFGAFQFIFSADTMFSKGYFGEDEMACYIAAGTLSRALLWLVLPLALVMFPKIVHSTAKSEHSNLQHIVLLGTLALGVCGALSLCVLGPWLVRIPYPAEYVRRNHGAAALVCLGHGAAGAGECHDQQPARALRVSHRAGAHRAGGPLRNDADPFSPDAGDGAAGHGRVQCAAGGVVCVVHVGE